MNLTAPHPSVHKQTSARRDDPEVDRWVAMLSAELDSEDRPKNSRPPTAVKNASVDISLEFGRTCLMDPTRDLIPGTMLRLDQQADEPLDLVVDGRVIARGELLVTAGKLGVRIVELLLLLIGFSGLASDYGFADEPVRPGKSARKIELFNAEADEVFEAPFGTTRGRRSAQQTTDIMPREPRSNSELDPYESIARTTGDSRSVPLTKPSSTRHNLNTRSMGEGDARIRSASDSGWGKTIWSLLAVIGLIAAGARWLKSRVAPSTGGLPGEVWDILGRESYDVRTAVLLVRCGSRLLLLSSSPSGLQTLAQITDPVEVDCLAGLCQSTQRDHGLAETFRSLLVRPVAPKLESEASRAPIFNDRRQSLPLRPAVPASPEVR